VVNKLMQLGLLEVLYTMDGKEYMTPSQLEREIRDEISVHGGRVNMVDLQQLLQVDLSHIESKVNELVHKDRFFTLVHGELMDKNYLDSIAEEINETLQEAGQVVISDLAKSFDLPTEFVLSVVETRLDSVIHGQIDPIGRNTLFTAAFIAHNIAKVRGVLTGVLRPVHISQLCAQYKLTEKIVLNILDTLVASRRLNGSIQGSKDKVTFVPEVYTKVQSGYVDTFFQQNSYMEYQQLSKVGIADGKQYIKKRYAKRTGILYLSSCCVSDVVVDQVDAAVEEACANNSWVDVSTLVPSQLNNDDINQILQKCVKGPARAGEIFSEYMFASKAFIGKCKSIFDPVMKTKALNDIKTSPSLFTELTKKEKNDLTESGTGDGKQSRKDERQKKANAGGGQKGGGGRGSRESGTKKTKNKYKNRKGNEDDDMDDDDRTTTKKSDTEFEFLSEEQICEVLISNIPDTSEDLLTEISSYLRRGLAREYQEVAKSIFLESTQVTTNGGKKKQVQDHGEKLNGLLTNVHLFTKGLNLFEGDTNVTLTKHLLKTLASDVVNIIFEIVANENLMSLHDDEVFSPEIRLKLLKSLPDKWKVPLAKLNSTLTGKSLEDFHTNLDVLLSAEYCDVVVKKVDKKKERQLLFNHRQCLIDQLERESEPPMALHLAVAILFTYHTNTLLHAPGRCIPQILNYLTAHLPISDHKVLSDYQDLVIQLLGDKSKGGSKGGDSEVDGVEEEGQEEKRSVAVHLTEGLPSIRAVVKNMKKTQHGE